jgi:predicted amidohydrolase YtcJ
MQRMNRGRFLQLASGCAALAAAAAAVAGAAADVVVLHARIYTADSVRRITTALAVRDGRFVYVGDEAGARAWIGPQTTVRDARGRLVLPRLIDSHIHPTTIVAWGNCDADNRPMTLTQISAFVRDCVRRYHTPPGEWVTLRQWNYGNGNQPSTRFPTMRAALDAATMQHPVHLLGSDGHHGAFNSVALAGARNRDGQVVGLSRATLAADFADQRVRVGVDAAGEPDGMVNETLQLALDGPDDYAGDREDFANLLRQPQRMTQRLASAGITAMLDAAMPQSQLPVYESLLAAGQLTVRTCIAQFLDPDAYRNAQGEVDFAQMVAIAQATRDHFAGNPLIRADVVKYFVDGGLDGDPKATPPTLPNGASLRPYLQPLYSHDRRGRLEVAGYVDTDSADCRAFRADPAAFAGDAAGAFRQRHGYLPDQCRMSDGSLYGTRDEVLAFVREFHAAGFALHMHVIGDRAVRVAVDAIEASRAVNGAGLDRDGLAHLELAAPEDVVRIGRDHLYVAFTYAWSTVNAEYDLTTVPFLDRIHGGSDADLHPADGYYERNAYPVRAVQQAGGHLVGGSDANVDTRDPRPLVNIARAVTRHVPGQRVLNPAQSIPVRDAIDSYTIDGARFLGWGEETGSIEVGKSAEFVILDRDILKLADSGHADAIEKARVLSTWFRGREVYVARP